MYIFIFCSFYAVTYSCIYLRSVWKDAADAVCAEIRKCLEKRVEKRAAKRTKLAAASSPTGADAPAAA